MSRLRLTILVALILTLTALFAGCVTDGSKQSNLYNPQRGLNDIFSPVGSASSRPPQPTQQSSNQGSLIQDKSVQILFSDGLYFDEQNALRQKLYNQVLPYVSERLDLPVQRKIYTLAFNRQSDCVLHGMASSDSFVAEVFTCDSIPSEQAIAIMAHEIAHLVSYERYGVSSNVGGDLLLAEGLATYGAARYWLGGDDTSLRAYVREQRAIGVMPELQESYRGSDVDAMNANYYQWASFVEFLHEVCGPDNFHELYRTGSGELGSASYLKYCGKSIDALEQDWLTWLTK